jgi:hypothetical protein
MDRLFQALQSAFHLLLQAMYAKSIIIEINRKHPVELEKVKAIVASKLIQHM